MSYRERSWQGFASGYDGELILSWYLQGKSGCKEPASKYGCGACNAIKNCYRMAPHVHNLSKSNGK